MGDYDSFVCTNSNLTGYIAKIENGETTLLEKCKIPKFTYFSRINDPSVAKNLMPGDWVASETPNEDGNFILYNTSEDEPELAI